MTISLKAFYNQASISIGDGADDPGTTAVYIAKSPSGLCHFLDEYLSQEAGYDLFIHGYPAASLVRDFIRCFTYVEAAGGLARNADNNYLLIKRFGIWDLPKGKIRKTEEPLAGALREVNEETGVTGLQVNSALPPTFHIYRLKGKNFLKKTHWFLMETTSSGALLPQVEEAISEVAWMKPADARYAIGGSYRSLADTLSPFISD